MFDGNQNGTRKLICSIVGGVVYSVGLWFLIDAGAYAKKHVAEYQPLKFQWFLPFIFGSICMLFINCWTAEDFRGHGLSENNTKRARTCFLLGFSGSVMCLLGAFWIAIEQYFNKDGTGNYPGAALIIASMGSILSAFIVRFGHW